MISNEGAVPGCEVVGVQVSLEESYNPQIGLDVFKEDPNFQETEKKYEVGLAELSQGLFCTAQAIFWGLRRVCVSICRL